MSKTTENNCNHWLELCRQLWNCALWQRQNLYKEKKYNIHKFEQAKQLPELKEYFPEFKTVNAQTLKDVIFRIDKSYKLYYENIKRYKRGELNDVPGIPKFKKYNDYESFTLIITGGPNGWRINGKYLTITNIGEMKLYMNRQILGDIKTVTITKKRTGKWFADFSCDNVPMNLLDRMGKSVELTFGMDNFITDSDGKIWENPKFYTNQQNKIGNIQRKLSRSQKNGENRKKIIINLNRHFEKINNQKKTFFYQIAIYYVQNYDYICIHDLPIHEMVKNKKIAKKVAESSRYMFRLILEHKCNETGKELIIKINNKRAKKAML